MFEDTLRSLRDIEEQLSETEVLVDPYYLGVQLRQLVQEVHTVAYWLNNHLKEHDQDELERSTGQYW